MRQVTVEGEGPIAKHSTVGIGRRLISHARLQKVDSGASAKRYRMAKLWHNIGGLQGRQVGWKENVASLAYRGGNLHRNSISRVVLARLVQKWRS
jgi:hypothetical protein